MLILSLRNILNKYDSNMELFENIPDLIEKKGIQIAESTAEWELLDECTKVILATLSCNVSTFEDSKTKTSEAERTRLALAHPDYRKHLEAKKIARQEMLRHKAEQNALETTFDYLRTMSANSRNQRY